MTLSVRLAVLAVLVALGARAPAQTEARRIEVSLGDYAFTPQAIEVAAGEAITLVLKNTDFLVPHNLTLGSPAAALAIDVDVGPGDVVEVPLLVNRPGSYEFYCNKEPIFGKSHRERGMIGTLVVR